MTMTRRIFAVYLAALLACAVLPAAAAEKEYKDMTPAEYRQQVHKDVLSTVARIKKVDPGIERFFKDSVGYVVFPRVGKAGFIFGGGTGDGELYEKGHVVGAASITLATVGLQAGVQEFSQIVFFKDQAALDRFKQNNFEFAANASAVILKAGASQGKDYTGGVAVFTHSTAGAMAEATVGTQKFSFKADAAPAKKKK
jgi:lipid-binding SYLF domain-containing protein